MTDKREGTKITQKSKSHMIGSSSFDHQVIQSRIRFMNSTIFTQQLHTHTHTHTHTHIYIYIYIYIERESVREREKEKKENVLI